MATRIANVIVPEVFVPYVLQRTMEKSRLIQSGIVVPDAKFDELARQGGTLINMPFWQDLSGSDEILSDTNPLTPGGITASKDVAVLHMRGRAWSVNDLAKALSGDDPMSAIGDLVAEYWNRREQALLLSTLAGIFATTLASSHVKSIAIEDGNNAGEDNLIGGAAFIDAATLLGDEADGLAAIMMHSVPFSRLQKLQLIEYVTVNAAGKRVEGKSEDTVQVPTFLGKNVIVDDTCPVASGTTSGKKYTSYIFAPGAIARGEGNAPTPVETDRDSLLGDDILIHRRHFLLHPRGCKFTSNTVAGVAPTNVECEIGANWTRVFEAKAVKIVKLVSNG